MVEAATRVLGGFFCRRRAAWRSETPSRGRLFGLRLDLPQLCVVDALHPGSRLLHNLPPEAHPCQHFHHPFQVQHEGGQVSLDRLPHPAQIAAPSQSMVLFRLIILALHLAALPLSCLVGRRLLQRNPNLLVPILLLRAIPAEVAGRLHQNPAQHLEALMRICSSICRLNFMAFSAVTVA